MDLLIATQNPGKFKEICELLASLPVNFVSLEGLDIVDAFPEHGESFEENALGKARFYSEKSGLATVADDSGIYVEALEGDLGLKTRRWGVGEQASDEEWLDYFLKRMEQEKNRRARFVCAAAYVGPLGQRVFSGESQGTLLKNPQVPVKPGIPLSSVFLPEGYDKVYAALSDAEKNQVSHRGRAFSQVLHFLCSSAF